MKRFILHRQRFAGTNLLHSIALTTVIILAQCFASAHGIETQNSSDARPVQVSVASTTAQTPSILGGAVSIKALNRPLGDVMHEIQIRCSTEVKMPQNLASDVGLRSVSGDSWQYVVGNLLEGYNYSAIWGKNGLPLQIAVYSRNQNAEEPASVAARDTTPASPSEDLLIYETSSVDLPQKFQGLNPGSVSPVSLPVDRMKEMALGEKVSLTLPCGQFEVVYDKRFQHVNGDVTWVGYLETSGKAFRVIITLGSHGNQGQMMTPDGAYNLDVEEGRTWLVDASATAMESESRGG